MPNDMMKNALLESLISSIPALGGARNLIQPTGQISPQSLAQGASQMSSGMGTIARQAPEMANNAVKGPASFIGKQVAEFSASLEGLSPEERQPYVKAFQNKVVEQLIGGGPKKAEAAQEETKQMPQTSAPQQPATPQPQQSQGPNQLMELLKRVGIPGLAAILGSTGAMPLASAAGLGSGYTKGFGGAEESKAETQAADKKLAVDLAKEQIKAQKDKTKTQKMTSADVKLMLEGLKESTGKIARLGSDYKQKRQEIYKKYTNQWSNETTGKVAIISPDGIPGEIPSSQLEAALKAEYKPMQ